MSQSIFSSAKLKSEYIRVLAIICLVLFAILPLLFLSFNIDYKDLIFVFNDKSFKAALWNSVIYSFVATVITVCLALVTAELLNLSNIKNKNFYVILLTLGMLVPTISIGLGIRILFGINGFLDLLFGITIDARGIFGLVLGSVIAAFPATFLIIYDALSYEDKGPYDAANIMGIGPWSAFCKITLPYLKITLLSAFFACFTLIFSDYGIPMELSGKVKTLPMYLFGQFMSSFQYGRGAVVGYVLLVPAVLSFIFNIIYKDSGVNSIQGRLTNDGKFIDVMAKVIVIVTSLLLFLPQLSFIALSFTTSFPDNLTITTKHVLDMFSNTHGVGLTQYLSNSLSISLATAFIGTCFTYVLAYYTVRKEGFLGKVINMLSLSTIAIPGLVLGIGFIFLFKDTNGFFYGTALILVVVNIFHFLGSPYILAKNCLSKINSEYEVIGEILGVSNLKIFFKVLVPNSITTLMQMFSYFFLNSMITISAVAFLCTYANQPLSILITSFEKNSNYEMQSVISVLILFVNVLFRVCFGLLENLIITRQNKNVDVEFGLTRSQFNVLQYLEANRSDVKDSDAIAINLGSSSEVINKDIKTLKELDYVAQMLDGDIRITERGLKALSPYKVRKAIILAAGFGQRLAPVTLDTPKPLVRVKGERIIDSLIDALIAKDINNITIVCGYKKEMFEELKEKYPGIQLVGNRYYNVTNNISSLLQVVERIDRCYICEADLIIRNPELIRKYEYRSNYFGFKVTETDDWCFHRKDGCVSDYTIGGVDCYQAVGISYWNSEDSEQLQRDIIKVYNSKGGKEHLWEQVPLYICKNHYKLDVRECDVNDVIEIDNFSELIAVDDSYANYPRHEEFE